MSPPLIMVCANLAWNLVNFRSGLIRALLDDGFAVMAVAPPDAAMEARLADLGCSFAPVAIDSAGLNPWSDLRTLFALRALVRRHRPVAWLSWTIKPNVYGAIAAAGAGIPAFPNVSGLGTAFIRRNALTILVKHLYRVGFSRAPAVFFQNADDRGLFLEQGLIAEKQARLVPGSGIDPAHFDPRDNARPVPRRFVMLARLVADKGVREYVAAARLVRAQFPDAHFELVGFLDVANRTAISAAEVAGWVAEGVIEYRPPVGDVRPVIEAADFVVLPSYREGLSRVLLETAALRRPIVTTDVPGCRDIVAEAVNGFLCAPRDAGSLAAALARACDVDESAWQSLAAASRAKVVAEFSQDRVTALYRAALSDAGVVAGSAA